MPATMYVRSAQGRRDDREVFTSLRVFSSFPLSDSVFCCFTSIFDRFSDVRYFTALQSGPALAGISGRLCKSTAFTLSMALSTSSLIRAP